MPHPALITAAPARADGTRPRALATAGALATACLILLPGCAAWRVDRAAQVAAGYASHVLCDDVFVAGLDPHTAYAERIEPLPGLGLARWALRHQVDADRREVAVSIGGRFESRARHRDGLGCTALPADEAEPEAEPPTAPRLERPADLPPIAGPARVEATDAGVRAALERAMGEAGDAPRHRTKALVVLRDGRLIAERYAPGFGTDTPVLGFSMTKSVTSALVGILVRQGRLALDQPAPLPAWADPADPRRAITVEHLLRQTSGLDLPQDNSGFDATSQIMYRVRDKAAVAAAADLAATPGTRWAYTDTNYLLLSRLVRDAVGGSAAAVRRFAQDELFGPLGIEHAVLDFDATGTPLGSSHLSASARDWARFGQLLLADGMAGQRRLLPEGWVRRATTPTLDTGYGAGLWTNRVPGLVPRWGAPWGLARAPADAYFARGFMGQFIVVVPAERLVIVRLSVSHVQGDDIVETDRIVGDLLAALGGPA